jgi:hypothetical protein
MRLPVDLAAEEAEEVVEGAGAAAVGIAAAVAVAAIVAAAVCQCRGLPPQLGQPKPPDQHPRNAAP